VPLYKRIIIPADSQWKSLFDALVLIFVAINCIWNVLLFAFDIDETTKAYYVVKALNLFIEAIFWIDFFMTFLQAYKDQETQEVITDLKLIAYNYFVGWFWIDIVSLFPF
tara:strand:- start:1787 stop:2116 length:330 start_codon:yes stop_codon:yes gene_type:complete